MQMAPQRRTDPLVNFRFIIEIDGLIVAGFNEISGIQLEVETEDYAEGGVNDRVHRLPKTARYPNLTLRRGMTNDTTLWEWQWNVLQGMVQRRTVNIILSDEKKEEQWQLLCRDAFPVRWTGPDLRATDNSIAIESLELAHNGLVRG